MTVVHLLLLNLLAGAPLLAADAPPQATQMGTRLLRYPAGAPQLAYLNIEAVKDEPVPVLEPQNGKLGYDDELTARVTSPVNGRVTRIAAKPGDRVRKGDVLLWLDAPDYVQAQADLEDARAGLKQKSIERERASALYKGEVLARKDFEAAQFDFERAREALRRAEARFRYLNPQGDTTSASFALRAPIDGVVTERHVNPGTEVAGGSGDPLFVITDPTHLWAIFELAERDVGKLRIGQPVAVSVEAYPERSFSSSIQYIGDVVDPATRRVVVRSEVDDPERRLKPEMYAKITPLAEGSMLPRVANTALITEGVKTYLFVEREPGAIEKREVKLAFRGPTQSWVSEGLKAGERVALTGALLLNSELAGQ